ncbi:MAG TPA: hypothetical protein VFW13_16135 [Phenylobacterium sp.]|nr:hypothetical protein [Phenylobacterium sp.]
MNWKLIVGALVVAICGWSILQVGRVGAVRGRMGGEWSRKDSAGIYWLSASALAAGLFAGALLVSAGLGASSLLSAAIAFATAAGSLMALARFGRDANRRHSR